MFNSDFQVTQLRGKKRRKCLPCLIREENQFIKRSWKMQGEKCSFRQEVSFGWGMWPRHNRSFSTVRYRPILLQPNNPPASQRKRRLAVPDQHDLIRTV